MVVAQVAIVSHSHHLQKKPTCPLAPLWPAPHSPACLLAPSSLGWEGLWDGQKSLRGADGAKESQWCVMPCSSPGPAGSNRQGHLRIQGEYSLFWGSRNPQQSGADPQPCLVKMQADHGWTLTHPWYFGKRWQCQACTCGSAGQHPACSGTHPPSVSPAGTARACPGHGWAVSDGCVIAHCLFS